MKQTDCPDRRIDITRRGILRVGFTTVLAFALILRMPPAWTQSSVLVGRLSQGRADPSLILLDSGLGFISGGHGRKLVAGKETSVSLDSAELYDPRIGAFVPALGRMISPRVGHACVKLPDGRVLLVGGLAYSGSDVHALSSVEVFDPAVAAPFGPSGSLLEARTHASASLLPSGRVLIAGGSSRSAEVFDSVTRRSQPTGSLHAARSAHVALTLSDGRPLMVGGGSRLLEVYSEHSGTFQVVGSSLGDVISAALLPGGERILILGRLPNQSPHLEIFDVRTSLSTVTDSVSSPLQDNPGTLSGGTALVALPSGDIAIIGGRLESPPWWSHPSRLFYRVDWRTGRISHRGALAVHRESAAAAALRSGQILVVGGSAYPYGVDASAEILSP